MGMPFAAIGPAILAAFGAVGAITRTRYPAGAYDANTGDWARAAGTALALEAVVQPSTPKEIESIPDGERTKEAITIFTLDVLLPSDVAGATESDVVTWKGRNWKVVLSEDWTIQAGYARAIATRIGV